MGDFDGDRATDVFRATGSHWQFWSVKSGKWRRLCESSLTIADVRFADVNRDGTTDVIDQRARTFFSKGTGPSERLPLSLHPFVGPFGDRDGDGRPDSIPLDFTFDRALAEVRMA